MPEIKRLFNASRMNRDLDDKMLKPGEYREALNINVSKSESSDIGAVENILGNELIVDTAISNAKKIGEYRDNGNDRIYYFITNNDYWKYIKSLNFLQEDRTTIYENIEKKGDIEFIKPGKIFIQLLNEAKKHSLSDTDLLHILLFMKLVCDKCYSVEDFPLLIKSDSIVINPLFT